MPVAPALVLALALQATPSDLPDKAAGAAALYFVMGCMVPISAYDTVAPYAAAAQDTGRALAADRPPIAGLSVDGADGRGCRIGFTGPGADRVWEADLKFLHGLPRTEVDPANGCTFTEDTAARLVGVCASTGGDATPRTRRADIVLERSGSGATERVTASTLNLRP